MSDEEPTIFSETPPEAITTILLMDSKYTNFKNRFALELASADLVDVLPSLEDLIAALITATIYHPVLRSHDAATLEGLVYLSELPNAVAIVTTWHAMSKEQTDLFFGYVDFFLNAINELQK